ncbi:MAG TPA: PIN domain-containing protein [Terriglobales bacterium]|nr:PIN domain-containing protein [Terriglobales bacterium]
MKRAVLADTGPLYASADPHDARHKQARQQLQKLAREKIEVLIAYPTLLEAYTLVLFRLGKLQAANWLQETTAAPLINPTPEDYRHAVLKVRTLEDQSITLFDAVVATLAVRLDVPVWTYDHHFDVMRIEVWR